MSVGANLVSRRVGCCSFRFFFTAKGTKILEKKEKANHENTKF